MLIVHHTRKQQADDKFDTISGTNGLLGAADGAFVLSKEKRTTNAATLESPAEISRISEYTLFAIRKNLYGNLKKAKQKFGQSRLTRCLKRYRLFFLRTVADGTGRLLN